MYRTLIAVFLFAVLANASIAGASIVVSNLDQPGPGAGWVLDFPTDGAAVEFHTGSEGSWNLTAATLAFGLGASGSDVVVGINSDNGGVPGVSLGSVQGSSPADLSDASFAFDGIVLAPDTSYWLSARIGDNGGGGSGGPTWAGLTPSTTTDSGSVWTIQGFAFGSGSDWTSLDRMVAFSLTATPTPEPSSVVLFALGAIGLFLAARRRKS